MKSNQKIQTSGNGKLRVFGPCSVTGQEYGVEVAFEDWKYWQAGALAQECFPYLTADQREYLISGITPAEWDETFKDCEE